MGRLMAIDYGTKRTGIAVSDKLQLIANGLTTVATHQLFIFLENYLKDEIVESIIVGHPKTLANEDSDNMKYVSIFVTKLKNKYPEMPIIFWDERFTSSMAQKIMIAGGLKKKDRQNKALVDEISATLILQDYMESLRLQSQNMI